ncbi:MAG TPA: PilN domain-containing protein [Aliidongia sp.]|uniref:PilN domain-containing protein n=1 Tax=Aliidongia sp. TaxID=1914230 RepID=UPI002DDC9D68|nr:PilN domain-containing protein [Aliidongia sp.]HEV2673304.1 PilN domain-containing protein [Aliidongia sp.]
MTNDMLQTARHALNAAVRWWLGELAGCLPGTLRRRLTLGRRELVIGLTSGRTARLAFRNGSETIELGEANLADDAESFVKLLTRHRTAAVVVRLPAEIALRSTVTLPLAAQRNLAEAVEFELPRRTPFQPDTVYHAFRVVRRDRGQAQLAIELTIAPRRSVDEMLGWLTPFGVTPRRVEIAGDARHPMASPDLTGQSRPSRQPLLRLAGPLGFAALASVLLIGAIVVPFVRMDQRIEALTQTVAAEKLAADEALKLQAEIRDRTRDAGFLDGRKRATASPTRILDALTRLLPDDTWLNTLDVKGDEIVIAGASASASSVIALLDRSASFRKPTFRSPVTQALRSSQEQFNIAVQLAGAMP